MISAWRLEFLKRAAWAALLAERLAVRFWSVAAALAACTAFCLTGLLSRMPSAAHVVMVLGMLGGLAALAWRAARAFTLPLLAEAERRLERDGGIAHRPFAVLRDQPADMPAAGLALWQLHQARARAAMRQVRLSAPNADLAHRDPFALRSAAVLVLVAGLVMAGPDAASRLAAAMLPNFAQFRGAPPVIEAWIDPPGYTGLAPVFLSSSPAADAITEVPAGSKLTISITGGELPKLAIGGRVVAMKILAAHSFQAQFMMTESGTIVLSRWFGTLGQWPVKLIPNDPPQAAWSEPPGRAGTSLSVRLPWQVRQRWGVASLEAVVAPKGRPGLPPLIIPLPLPGTPKQATGSATQDYSENPYAGVTMTAHLNVRDVSGQTAHSSDAEFVLPARPFHHPLARAIADLRRRLALHPAAVADAAADLAALAEAPKVASPVNQSAVILNLAAAGALLTPQDGAQTVAPADIAQAQALLYTLALALDGALPDASVRALAEARENLRRGLADHAQGKLSDKALNDRLDALRQALDKRMADLAREAMKQGALQKFDPQTQHLSSPAMNHLIQKLERALKDGRMEDARDAMARLERMMDQLKSAHIMSPEEAQQAQQQRKEGRQQMGAIDDLLQRETTLLDHAQSRAPGVPAGKLPGVPQPGLSQHDRLLPFGQFPMPSPNGTDEGAEDSAPDQPDMGNRPDGAFPDTGIPKAASPPAGSSQGGGDQVAQDARVQRALHRALDALKSGLSQSGRKPPASFDDAGHAMDDAAQSLAGHDEPQARDAEARAIAALQKGGQSMSQQMSQGGSGGMQLSLQPGAGSGGSGDDGEDDTASSQDGRKKDPFGRQVDGNGSTADDPMLNVPDTMEQGRSRAIQEELRRRGADRARSKTELDYIDRLLKPF